MISHFFTFFSCIGNIRVRGAIENEKYMCQVYIVENKKVYKKRYSKNLVLGIEVGKRW